MTCGVSGWLSAKFRTELLPGDLALGCSWNISDTKARCTRIQDTLFTRLVHLYPGTRFNNMQLRDSEMIKLKTY